MPQVKVKDAVRNAISFLEEIQLGRSVGQILVEEVFFDSEANDWIVILSHDFPGSSSSMAMLSGNPPPRQYKRFIVQAEDGEITNMSIWSPEG